MDEETKASIRTLLIKVQYVETLFSDLSDRVTLLSQRIEDLNRWIDRTEDRVIELERG